MEPPFWRFLPSQAPSDRVLTSSADIACEAIGSLRGRVYDPRGSYGTDPENFVTSRSLPRQ